jgi:TPR repeat protein
MYANGKGVKQDYKKAVEWYQKTADQGYVTAQYNLGLMYENGKGVKQDYKKAVEWYQKAADQGDAPAKKALDRLSKKSILS